jgi:hypothetical protein
MHEYVGLIPGFSYILFFQKGLGLDETEEGSIAVIINTCMSPWLRAQKTFKRIGIIIRNELYNAHGAVSASKLH